jgi:hypothetical protein
LEDSPENGNAVLEELRRDRAHVRPEGSGRQSIGLTGAVQAEFGGAVRAVLGGVTVLATPAGVGARAQYHGVLPRRTKERPGLAHVMDSESKVTDEIIRSY